MGFPSGSVVKNWPAKSGDSGEVVSIPGLGRSPGGGNGNRLKYSFLEHPIDICVCVCVLSHSVMSDSLRPYEL